MHMTHVLPALLLLAFGSLAVATAAPEQAKSGMALARTRQLLAANKPVRVVIYGDSISEVKTGWAGGAKTAADNWGAVLGKQLGAAYPTSPITVQQFGIGGQNSYEGLGRLDTLAAAQPDLVLVAFGANDCCYHYLLPEETQLALTTLATEIRKRFGADVILVGTGGDNPLKPFFKHLDATVAAQRAAAAEAQVPFVDMRAAMLQATEQGKQWGAFHWTAENCHPNNAGHQVWAQTAFAIIQASLKN